jgi:hypothetical protein
MRFAYWVPNGTNTRSLLSHDNSSCANAPQLCVIRTLPVFLKDACDACSLANRGEEGLHFIMSCCEKYFLSKRKELVGVWKNCMKRSFIISG